MSNSPFQKSGPVDTLEVTYISYPRMEPLHKTICTCRSALVAAHANAAAPHVYEMGGNCVVLTFDRQGLVVRPIRKTRGGAAVLKGILSRVVDFRRRRPADC